MGIVRPYILLGYRRAGRLRELADLDTVAVKRARAHLIFLVEIGDLASEAVKNIQYSVYLLLGTYVGRLNGIDSRFETEFF